MSSAVGAYSVRSISGAAHTKAVLVRNGVTGSSQEIFADAFGNLSTFAGEPLAGWLNGAPGFVSVWYDQSANGNDFLQPDISMQPLIVQLAGKWCIFFNFGPFMTTANEINNVQTIALNWNTLPNPVGAAGLTDVFNTVADTWQTILGNAGVDNFGFRFNNPARFFAEDEILGDSAIGGRVGADYLALAGSYWYLNGQYGYEQNDWGSTVGNNGEFANDVWNYVVAVSQGAGPSGCSSAGGACFPWSFNAISDPAGFLADRKLNGYLGEMILFQTKINASDAAVLLEQSFFPPQSAT